MFFSDYYKIDDSVLNNYGAIDISLEYDTPLFIDPMLIFNSDKEEYKALHDSIIRYFHYLAQRSQETSLSEAEIIRLYSFSEVKENWLGYSVVGNGGLALGKAFSLDLAKNIGFVLDTNKVTKSVHIEKLMLLKEGTGKDKISDMTTNLIKGYLANYTEKFARDFINEKFCDTFYVERSEFNYNTESFVSKKYYLPYILRKGKKEYVLLTPQDIVRDGEPAINRRDMLNSYNQVRACIPNEELRSQLDHYIGLAIKKYDKEHPYGSSERGYKKAEREAFAKALNEWPILYDYYIKYKEEDIEGVTKGAADERDRLQYFCIKLPKTIAKVFGFQTKYKEQNKAIDEARERIKFLKNRIEYGGLYKNFYYNGEQIVDEPELQRLLPLIWYNTDYVTDQEVNNGTGPVDFKVSKGRKNQVLIEFKLASNTKLKHVFEQVDSYENSNRVKDSLIVIFYFNEKEESKVSNLIQEFNLQEEIGNKIIIIDCRADNKVSASKK